MRVTYRDYKSTFLELLQKDNSVTIHQPNLQVLEAVASAPVFSCEFCEISKNTFLHRTPLVAASKVLTTEVFKAKNDLSPESMKEVFELKERSCSLCSQGNYFVHGNIKTLHYYIQSIKYLARNIWDLIPDQIKYCVSLTKSENFIKSWSPSDCPCHLIRHNNEIR